MILSPKLLLKLVKTKKLVERLCERELNNPEGTGFDLRLGEVYKISGFAFLGETHRQTPDIETIETYKEGKTRTVKIKPGDFYLVKTIEKINLPLDLAAQIIPRTTTFRSGLFIRTGPVQPGYCGELTFGLKNEGPVTVEIEMGARFVHLIFHEIKGVGSQYRGQWQGGRVTTKKRERQI
jgi:deoxycytidine triphosphate deaminase